jgi:dipeptidyl aminopeptidase/acylaminoacyl peptidase
MPTFRRIALVPILFSALLVAGCSSGSGDATASGSDYTVSYFDRTIDIEPFLIGFPYSGHDADLENGHLFYFERTEEGRWLRHQALSAEGRIDHEAGEKLTDQDWSKRSIRLGEFHPPSGKLFVSADEANDEHFNVYTIDLADGSVEQLTQNDYTYSFGLSDDDRYLAYLARKGLKEPFETTLHVRDLTTGEDRAILSDEAGADRYTWSYIRFTPDDKSVILSVQHDGQRNTKSLARIDLDSADPRFEYLHPDRVTRYSLGQVRGWVSDGVFLYTSAEEGFNNVYRHDLASGRSTRLTDFEDELGSTRLVDTDPPALLAVLRRPHESELQVLDANTGELLHREVVSATLSILDAHGTDAVLTQSSLTTPWLGRRLKVSRTGDTVEVAWSPFAGIPPELEEKISHYVVERVSYPTFDTTADGKPRMLHGFLLTPKNPPADERHRLVRITSFYGGSNRFDTGSQLMAAAGIATFSPAPRGSSGFGAEFAALNDGDLGGDEIVDIIYAAKWLQAEKGYEPSQIGVWGGSHGGYATMRALTFPPETNGRDAHFDFGFGWSHAGFSNILTFYDSCNIPDWVVKEAGDPETERDKLLDRSPISHVDLLSAPLLLTHGSNDWRVPPDESRTFNAKAQELGKPVTYVEFEGQGHGIRGFDNLVQWYQTVLTFFESVAEANAAS